MAPGIFVAGALHLDVVVDAPRLPGVDETLAGSGVAYRFGGKGGNQAVAAARLGGRAAMAGRVGRDRFGEQILSALDRAGVDRTQVRVCDGASGMSVAIVDPAGDYGAVIVSGVNREIDAADIVLPADTSIMLLQNEIPETVNRALAQRAGADVRILLNAAPARALDPVLAGRVDVLIVNRVEAAMLAGGGGVLGDPLGAARALRALGPRAVVVTLGAEGVAGVDATGATFRAPAFACDVVSTHGAGDAFVGALAVRLSDGAALPAALGFAQAAAALVVSRPVDDRAAVTAREADALAAGLTV